MSEVDASAPEFTLGAGRGVDALSLALEHEPLSGVLSGVLSGAPTAAVRTLLEFGEVDTGAVEIGVWEMTPGTAADTEADEVFIVLSGRAQIVFVEPALPTLELGPGSVVRLAEGMRTEWTVTETLRKVYIA